MYKTIRYGVIARKIEEWKDTIRMACSNGFEHVELRVDNVESEAIIFNSSYQAELRDLIRKSNVSVSIHGIEDIDFGEEIQRIRDTISSILIDQIRLGEVIGAEWITFHTGRCHFRNRMEKKLPRLNNVVKMIKTVLNQTDSFKINIGIENLPRKAENYGRCYTGDCMEELLMMVNGIKHDRVRIIVDIGHLLLNERTRSNMMEDIKAVDAYLLALHFHWNDWNDDMHRGLTKEDVEKNRVLLAGLLRYASLKRSIVLEMPFKEAVITRNILNEISG